MPQLDPAATRSVGGQSFRVATQGPSVDRFDALGGAYRTAWDKVAAQLQTHDRARIVAELTRQIAEQSSPPAGAARAILAAA